MENLFPWSTTHLVHAEFFVRSLVFCIDMIYDIFVNCNWVVTRWQYTFTHNNTQNKTNNNRTTQITTNVEECGPCPVFAIFTLTFALQLRKKHGKSSVRVRKTSVRLRKTSVRVQYTYYQNTHTLQNPHKHTHYKTHTYTHTHYKAI